MFVEVFAYAVVGEELLTGRMILSERSAVLQLSLADSGEIIVAQRR